MLRDITLGQYYQGESAIHRLDARTKIIGVIVYIVVLFLVKDFVGYLIAAAAVFAVTKASGVPFRYIMRGMKPILMILALTFVLNLFMYPGTVLVSLGPLKITQEGAVRAVYMAVRLILLIMGTSLLTYTTKPMQLTDGMEMLMSPLRRFGFPAHEIAMMMSIALRFIPLLVQEADKIMKAQQARGVDFESGKLMHRIKNLVPLMIPLFIGAFHIAQDLALAMEARCYRGGEGRTRLHTMRLGRSDAAAFVMMTVFAAMIIVLPLCERAVVPALAGSIWMM